jgi:hypothetical protein
VLPKRIRRKRATDCTPGPGERSETRHLCSKGTGLTRFPCLRFRFVC